MNMAQDSKLPEKFMDNFNLTGSLPNPPSITITGETVFDRRLAERDAATTVALDAIDEAKVIGGDALDSVKSFLGDVFPGAEEGNRRQNEVQNERLRKNRIRVGANPDTGTFPIRRTN